MNVITLVLCVLWYIMTVITNPEYIDIIKIYTEFQGNDAWRIYFNNFSNQRRP